jgi:hypothetical protein
MTDGLVGIFQNLADVLMRENEALKRLDFAAAVALTPKTLTPPLVALGRLLGSLAAENQVLLERAIEVQTRIVRIVARAGAPRPEMVRYGGHGGRAPSNRTSAMALSTRA